MLDSMLAKMDEKVKIVLALEVHSSQRHQGYGQGIQLFRCPSSRAFLQAPRKLFLVSFGRNGYGYQTCWSRSGGGVQQHSRSRTLTVLLVLPIKTNERKCGKTEQGALQ